jgi:cytochrome c biogenesis factor
MPMVGWIWFAVILMGIGGLVALIPSRRVIPSEARDPLTTTAPALS